MIPNLLFILYIETRERFLSALHWAKHNYYEIIVMVGLIAIGIVFVWIGIKFGGR